MLKSHICNRVLRAPTAFRAVRAVSSYTLPNIHLLEELNVNKQDFKGLFSHSTYNQLWFQRGEKLIEELNELLIENQVNPPNNLNELISLTINKPQLQKIYSNSSLLFNLQFFLEGLKEANETYEFQQLNEGEIFRNPDITEVSSNIPQNEAFKDWLSASFGSITEFKNLLLNSAKAIKGDGTTWLVAQPNVSESSLKSNFTGLFNESNEPKYTKLSVMNTYNAGVVDDSIRSGQLFKLQQQKKAKLVMEQEKEGTQVKQTPETENYLGTVEEAEFTHSFSDKKIIPLLAVDASLRNYLLDYGVFGKQQYLENVWNCVNWSVVEQRLPPRFIANFTIE